MMARAEIRIPNRRDKMSEVGAMIENFVKAHGGSREMVHDLGVALDEVLNNIISYGYGPEEHGHILVRVAAVDDRIVVEVEDTGRPFDPLAAPTPDLSGPLRQRKVGGLGIHFVKQLMDEVEHARIAGTNRLRLHKRFPAAPAAHE